MTRSSSRQRNVPPPAGAGAAGAKAAIYARFIPREELSSFAAWSPGDLSGAGPATSSAAAQAEPTPPVDPVEQQAELVRQARQSGYQDGYRDGLVALEGFKQSFAHQATLQVGQLVKASAASSMRCSRRWPRRWPRPRCRWPGRSCAASSRPGPRTSPRWPRRRSRR